MLFLCIVLNSLSYILELLLYITIYQAEGLELLYQWNNNIMIVSIATVYTDHACDQ